MSGYRDTENGRPIKTGGIKKDSTEEVRHDKRVRGDCARQMNGEGHSLLPYWKGEELAARDLCFSPENQTGPQKPHQLPQFGCVFVPLTKMNCSIIIFLSAAEQPQTRSKTQTDLKLIRTTDLDILPMHQTTRHCRGQHQPGRCVPRDFSVVPCFP